MSQKIGTYKECNIPFFFKGMKISILCCIYMFMVFIMVGCEDTKVSKEEYEFYAGLNRANVISYFYSTYQVDLSQDENLYEKKLVVKYLPWYSKRKFKKTY